MLITLSYYFLGGLKLGTLYQGIVSIITGLAVYIYAAYIARSHLTKVISVAVLDIISLVALDLHQTSSRQTQVQPPMPTASAAPKFKPTVPLPTCPRDVDGDELQIDLLTENETEPDSATDKYVNAKIDAEINSVVEDDNEDKIEIIKEKVEPEPIAEVEPEPIVEVEPEPQPVVEDEEDLLSGAQFETRLTSETIQKYVNVKLKKPDISAEINSDDLRLS